MSGRKIAVDVKSQTEKQQTPESIRHRSRYDDEIRAISKKPKRHWLLHWLAITQSLISAGILIYAMAAFREPPGVEWVWLDVGLGVLFLIEFFTRSGFRWDPRTYVISHIFDFIALVPALAFLNQGVPAEVLWIWIILFTRILRVSDRILGDGFLLYNFFVLLDGFFEEITDRVVLRLMDRLEADMIEGKFGHNAADAMAANKKAVLQRVREEHPRDNLTADLARFVGLEAAVERAEGRIYDAMVDVTRSPEVDKIIQNTLNTVFDGLRAETGKRDWIKRLGNPDNHNGTL